MTLYELAAVQVRFMMHSPFFILLRLQTRGKKQLRWWPNSRLLLATNKKRAGRLTLLNERGASHHYGATFYYVGLICVDWAPAGRFDPGEINLTRISRTWSLKWIGGHLLLNCH